MPSHKDLHFKVTFPDGSVWEDYFKRADGWSERKQEYLPTTKFLNDFLSGPDLMSALEFKLELPKWLGKSHPRSNFKLVWYYA